MDDDVSGAFRHVKYALLLIAMHNSIQCNLGVFNTGGTFGDNTTPPNWDIIAQVRQQLAQWLWLHSPNIVAQAAQYLPPLTLATPALASTSFAPAQQDTLNPGVLDAKGDRCPPPFDHHVDDCGIADVAMYVPRGVAASTLALYHILGFPSPNVPDPQSKDKLNATYSHTRKFVGRAWNTRTLRVGMLDYKRLELIDRFKVWVAKPKFTLVEAAELQGILENHTRYAKWARAWFFAIQNAFRRHFTAMYFITKRRFAKMKALKQQRYSRELPRSLRSRIEPLIARDKASMLWNMR